MAYVQRGFTLIEISIVLVIIGLLLGGVLKGQELINDAKIRNIEKDMDGITAAIYTYQDRYKALPGNDKGAAGRWGEKVASGGANGEISADEAWSHLRYAGLLQGDPEVKDAPRHAAGGAFDVQGASGSLLLCAKQLPRKFTEIIDTHQDDGKPKTGRLRVFAGTGDVDFGKSSTEYDTDDTTTYTLCKLL